MSLSCTCDYDYADYYIAAEDDFELFKSSRRKRCLSCKKLINNKTFVLRLHEWRAPFTDMEERFHGDQVYLADKFLCETCGEIYLNLTDIGLCVDFSQTMQENLRDYHDMTGFESEKYTETGVK